MFSRFLQVQVQPATAHVRVTPKDSSGGELLFTVKGSELGETTVVATAAFSGRSASSSAAPIHVFPPLELEPRNVTLIVGAKFQVKTVGGPMPGRRDQGPHREFKRERGPSFLSLSGSRDNFAVHFFFYGSLS